MRRQDTGDPTERSNRRQTTRYYINSFDVERGIRTIVLEAHEPGWGGSGRNGGQVIPGLKYDPDELERMVRGALGTNNLDHCTRLCHSTSVAAMNRALSTAAASGGLLLALLLALGGGLVLNLMPCVLPVLSLKAIGLAESASDPAAARHHALWYTAGVLASFALVGALVLGLRAAGAALGWGFQLQQPVVVAILIYILYLIA